MGSRGVAQSPVVIFYFPSARTVNVTEDFLFKTVLFRVTLVLKAGDEESARHLIFFTLGVIAQNGTQGLNLSN
jgi:hypothetical protein